MTTPPITAAIEQTAAAAGGAPATPADSSAKWWESATLSDGQRQYLTAKGLTVDDPMAALPKIIDGHISAEKRLGVPADQLLTRPKADQPVADWMRANGEMFGIPETADKYKITRPEDLGKGVDWDEGFEKTARELAHKHGVPQAGLDAFVGAYAARVKTLLSDSETELAAASAEMNAALQKDWGDQTPARIAQAKQGAQALAQAAGLDDAAMQNVYMALKQGTGDANVMRLFQAAGAMMGEDTGMGLGKGTAGFGTTPAEARAEIAKQTSPGGAWYEAVSKNDQRAVKDLRAKMDGLARIAAQK